MSIEAMKQALEALEYTKDFDHPHYEDQLTAITALRQAIEQAEKQEPVAWLCEDPHQIGLTTIIYTTPPKKEWIGLIEQDVHDAFQFTELIKQLSWEREPQEWCENFAAYIEAKLKEKNNG